MIDGANGTGKSLTLAHLIHYGSTAGFMLVHVPWGIETAKLFKLVRNIIFFISIIAPDWFRRFKEIVPSTTSPGKFDNPVESVQWLKHFSLQNGPLLQQLNVSRLF